MFINLKIQGNKDISFSLFLVFDIWNFYCSLKLLNGNGVFLFSFGNGFYGFTNKNMYDSKLLAEKFVMYHARTLPGRKGPLEYYTKNWRESRGTPMGEVDPTHWTCRTTINCWQLREPPGKTPSSTLMLELHDHRGCQDQGLPSSPPSQYHMQPATARGIRELYLFTSV